MPYKNLRRSAPALDVVCKYCGNKTKHNAKGVAQYVGGWVANRDAGGANHILFPNRYNSWAHVACLEDDHKPNTEQLELFG